MRLVSAFRRRDDNIRLTIVVSLRDDYIMRSYVFVTCQATPVNTYYNPLLQARDIIADNIETGFSIQRGERYRTLATVRGAGDTSAHAMIGQQPEHTI
jgi:hypothetical protein